MIPPYSVLAVKASQRDRARSMGSSTSVFSLTKNVLQMGREENSNCLVMASQLLKGYMLGI